MSNYRIEPNFSGTKFNLVLITIEGHEIDFGDYAYRTESAARAAAERDRQERANESATFVVNDPFIISAPECWGEDAPFYAGLG